MTIRLIQISDLHLGRSFATLGGPPELAETLHAESLAALRRAVELAGERDAAALLIPGDLFDGSELEEGLYRTVRDILGACPRPVLVSPGNHDPFGPVSMWNRAALERLGLPVWPEHVHVFTTQALTPCRLCDGTLVVYGHSVVGYHGADDTPLGAWRRPEGDGRHVLCFHGSLAGAPRAERMTMPFTTEQLGALGADYAAVGHYHRYMRIEHDGRLLGAYGGNPVPGDWGEEGVGGLLVVELGDRTEVELVRSTAGRVARLTMHGDPPLVDVEDTVRRVRRVLRGAELGSVDIVAVTLTGFSDTPLDAGAIEAALAGAVRHLVVRDRTEPEVDGAGGAAGARVTVESQFLARMAEEIARCGDAVERALLESARRYGVLALRGREICPPARGEAAEPAEAPSAVPTGEA